MNYLSVASGIDTATVAWHPLGWRPWAFSQFDPDHDYTRGPDFASAVLAQRYPHVPNLGDMTRFQEWPDGSIELLVGGTPCQTFSVAGLGAGLDDPRGDLMLTYGAIARRYRPRWLVWENVRGVLSHDRGRSFASLLGLLSGQRIEVPPGGWKSAGIVPGYRNAYGLAWRVLDTQFVRVDGFNRAIPQRRRRVFVVGYLGDWRRAAAVFLEPESMRGDPPPRRKPGQGIAADVAPSLIASGRGVERAGETRGQDPVVAVNSGRGFLKQSAVSGGLRPSPAGQYDGTIIGVPAVANPLTRRMFKGVNTTMDEGQTMVPSFGPFTFKPSHFTREKDGAPSDVAFPLSADADKGDQDALICQPVAASLTRGANSGGKGGYAGRRQEDDVNIVIGFNARQDPDSSGNIAGPIDRDGATQAIAFQPHDSARRNSDGWNVRRLMPVECERLQGFPDGFTDIIHRGKPAADGPRYQVLGNAMSANVMRWLGTRIQMVEDLE